MSSGEWELEPDSEREILLAWLEQEPDPSTRERVVDYIAGLASDPDRRWLYEEDARVYAFRRLEPEVRYTRRRDRPSRRFHRRCHAL